MMRDHRLDELHVTHRRLGANAEEEERKATNAAPPKIRFMLVFEYMPRISSSSMMKLREETSRGWQWRPGPEGCGDR